MSALLLAFLAVIVTGLGARDQATLATLVARQGARPMLLVVAVAASLATAAFAAWAAGYFIPLMTGPARLFMAMVALGLAGIELVLLSGPRRTPEEPTLSLGAAGIVLLAHQATDAARFLVFAVAVAFSAPLQAGLGGAAGGGAAMAIGWLAPKIVLDARLRSLRRWIGGALIVVAGVIGFDAIR